jgi:hypothetical protein
VWLHLVFHRESPLLTRISLINSNLADLSRIGSTGLESRQWYSSHHHDDLAAQALLVELEGRFALAVEHQIGIQTHPALGETPVFVTFRGVEQSIAWLVRRYYWAVSTELKQHLDSAIASEAVLGLNPEGIISDTAVANSCKERHFRRAKRTRSLARVVDKRVSPNLMTRSKQVVTVIEIIHNPRP